MDSTEQDKLEAMPTRAQQQCDEQANATSLQCSSNRTPQAEPEKGKGKTRRRWKKLCVAVPEQISPDVGQRWNKGSAEVPEQISLDVGLQQHRDVESHSQTQQRRSGNSQQCSPGGVESRVPGFPALPVSSESYAWAVGPHDTCNYLLPGTLLAGSYPGDRTEPGHTAKVRALLEAGVDTFVCLQQSRELSRFRPYIGTARSLAADLCPASSLEFLHCPIPDGHINQTSQLEVAIATIVDKLLVGCVVYVHCWGGHGRTGTVLCGLLVKVYGLNVESARDFFMAAHKTRSFHGATGGGFWPHSDAQYEQVRSLEAEGPELSRERLGPLDEWAFPTRTRA